MRQQNLTHLNNIFLLDAKVVFCTTFAVTHPNSFDISPDCGVEAADGVSCQVRCLPHSPRAVPQPVDGDGEVLRPEVGGGTNITFCGGFRVDNGHLACIEL